LGRCLLQQKLPVTDVDPAAKLPADLLKLCNLPKAKALMQRDARRVGQGDAPNDGMEVALAQRSEQLLVEF